MKNYKFFEAILFVIVVILSYIKVFNQSRTVFILLILFSTGFTMFVAFTKNTVIKKIIKICSVWIMVVSICFFKMPSLPLGFLTIVISVWGLITRQLED